MKEIHTVDQYDMHISYTVLYKYTLSVSTTIYLLMKDGIWYILYICTNVLINGIGRGQRSCRSETVFIGKQ